MNTNYSTNIRQNYKPFLCVSIDIRRSCLVKKMEWKISWHCPFRYLFMYHSREAEISGILYLEYRGIPWNSWEFNADSDESSEVKNSGRIPNKFRGDPISRVMLTTCTDRFMWWCSEASLYSYAFKSWQLPLTYNQNSLLSLFSCKILICHLWSTV
jgi:hypothetical protein